jgi:hypothetical protein
MERRATSSRSRGTYVTGHKPQRFMEVIMTRWGKRRRTVTTQFKN